MFILKRIDSILKKLEGYLVFFFLALMVGLTFLQVCLRGLYTHAHIHWANTLIGYFDWSEPFVRLLVLWLTFLGASLVTREDKHIKIDLCYQLLSPRLLLIRNLIISIVCSLVSGIMVKVSLEYIKMEIEFGGTMFLKLPSWLGQSIIPIGFALIHLRFLLGTIINGSQLFYWKNQ